MSPSKQEYELTESYVSTERSEENQKQKNPKGENEDEQIVTKNLLSSLTFLLWDGMDFFGFDVKKV